MTVVVIVAGVAGILYFNRVAPSSQESTTTQQAQPDAQQPPSTQPAQPTYALLDSDPEYIRLREAEGRGLPELVHGLQTYRDAMAQRESLINAKVGNISDPALHNAMAADAEQSTPKIAESDYAAEALAEVLKQRQAYISAHKDDFFIVGTYEVYFSSSHKVMFNLGKKGNREGAAKFASENFGTAILPHDTDIGTKEYDVRGMGRQTDERREISEDRYQADWLIECDEYHNRDCSDALLVEVSPEVMDAVYAEVAKRFSQQMDTIYAAEMKIGGHHPSWAQGSFVPYSGTTTDPYWSSAKGSDNDNCKCDSGLRDRIRAYVRRQAIWIIGKGDPMNPNNITVREAYLVVGGKLFAKLK